MKAHGFHHSLPVFRKCIDRFLVNISGKEHSLLHQLPAFADRCQDLLFGERSGQTRDDLFFVKAFLEIRKRLVCHFVHQMDTTAVDIQNNVHSIALVAVNQTHIKQSFPGFNTSQKEAADLHPLLINYRFTAVTGLLLLAALISHGAGSLACRLAGCLALAASTLLYGILQIFRIQCLDMLHYYPPYLSKGPKQPFH